MIIIITTNMVLNKAKRFPLFTFKLVQSYPPVPTPNSSCFCEFQGSKRPLPDLVGLNPFKASAG